MGNFNPRMLNEKCDTRRKAAEKRRDKVHSVHERMREKISES